MSRQEPAIHANYKSLFVWRPERSASTRISVELAAPRAISLYVERGCVVPVERSLFQLRFQRTRFLVRHRWIAYVVWPPCMAWLVWASIPRAASRAGMALFVVLGVIGLAAGIHMAATAVAPTGDEVDAGEPDRLSA
jgi:hypothetical protein